MLRKLRKILSGALFSVLVWNMTSMDAHTSELFSCYNNVKIGDLKVPDLSRELFVVVDQTVVFDKKIQEESYLKIQNFLSSGDVVHIIGFSANAEGRYTERLFSAQLDPRLRDQQRYTTGVSTLRKLDNCQKIQETELRKNVGKALIFSFSQANTELPKTEILSSLNTIANDIVARSKIADKYMLVISDMMENSELLTFYGNGALKRVSADKDLDRVQKAGLIGDMQGTKTYIIGGGYMPDGNYRPSSELNALKIFWAEYFRRSNATINMFGTPSLLGEIGD